MLIADLLYWWYGAGWVQLLKDFATRIHLVSDAFSITLLLKTLFAPFRRISDVEVNGPLDVVFRAWLDLQISRLIGAFIRLAVILAGLVSIIVVAIFFLFCLIVWLLMPLVPIATLIFSIWRSL